jgi:hypothetical protein
MFDKQNSVLTTKIHFSTLSKLTLTLTVVCPKATQIK